MKITKEQIKETLKLVMNEEADYKVFFKKALEKAGKSIPSMSDDEKKAFFNKIDAAWDAKSEVKEGNAFGAAVVAAKEAGEDEFEVDGEKFKVEESVNEAMNDNLYVVIDFHEKGGGYVMTRPSSQKLADDSARSITKTRDISKREVLKVKDARKIRHLVGKEYFKNKANESHSDCGCGCGGVTEGGCSTNVTEELVNEAGVDKISLLKDLEKGRTSQVEGVKISKDLAFELRMFLQRPMLKRSRTGIKINNSQMSDVIPMLVKLGIHKRLSSTVKQEFADLLKKYK